MFDAAAASAVDDHLADKPAGVSEKTATPDVAPSTPDKSPIPGAPTTLFIVDARVAGYQSLLIDLPGNVMVRVINADESGLNAITQALDGVSGSNTIESIQILSHGSSGSVTLGSDTLNSSTLSAHSAQLQGWASRLSASADILLYGCDVAAGIEGRTLISQLASITNADIAASANATGSADRGGDWVLEQQTGPIDSRLVISDAALAHYSTLLAAPSIGGASAGQAVNDNATRTPFSAVTITDADAGNTQTLTVTLDAAAKGSLSNLSGGSYNPGSGVYTFSGSDVAAQAAIRGLVFTPTANRVAPGATETTTFTISVNDGTTTVTNNTSTVVSTSINDAPQAFADSISISEDSANVTGNVLTNDTDVDTGDTKTVSALTGGTVGSSLTGSYGTLLLNASGSYTYTLDNYNAAVQALALGQTLTETFHYTMKDTANAAASTDLVVIINGSNDQPTLIPSGILLPQTEGVSTAFSVSNLLTNASAVPIASDTDSGTVMGVAITAAPMLDAASSMTGTWEYRLSGGAWMAFPAVSANNALLLPGDAQVRFVVLADNQVDSRNSGKVSLTYTAWDASSGTAGGTSDTTSPTGTSPFSSASNTAALNVIPDNDPPTFSSSALIVSEHVAITLSGGFSSDSTVVLSGNLRIYDPDNSATQILYRIEELPGKGSLTLGGATLAVGSLFSQSDVTNITYTPTVGELNADTTDRVYFSIRDGAGGVIGTDGKNTGSNPWAYLDITVKDVNAPISIGGTSLAIAEDNAQPGVAVIAPVALSLGDADDPSGLRTLTLTSLPTATFGTLQYWDGSSYQTATAGLVFSESQLSDALHPALRFSYNNATEPTDGSGNLIASQSQTTFTVSASDNNDHLAATTASATVTINITPVNDAPILVTHDLTVNQGSANNTIGTANLTTTDVDSPSSQRTYTVGIDATKGFLTLNGVRIGRGSTFSESDLSSGRVKYTCNDPYFFGSDSLQVVAADGHGGNSGIQTLNVVIADLGATPPITSGGGANPASISGSLQGVAPEGLFLSLTHEILNDNGTGSTFTVSAPAHGKIYLSGVEVAYGVTPFSQSDIDSGRVVYVHDGLEADSYTYLDTLNITATKSASVVTQAFTVTITPIDDAPTITQTIGSLALNQGGSTLMEQHSDGSNGMSVANFALTGILNAVKLSTSNFQWNDIDNTQSQLTYMASAVGGILGRWNGTAWVAVTTSFSADDLAAGNIAYFHDPATDVASPDDTTMIGSVTVYLIDGGTVAAGDLQIAPPIVSESATLTVIDGDGNVLVLTKADQMRSPSRTLSFTVSDVNDAPVASNTSFTVNEFSSGIVGQTNHIQILNTSLVAVSDADTGNSTWTYTLTALPTDGTVEKWNGSAWVSMALNSTFTYAELAAGDLRYVNAGRLEIDSGFSWSNPGDSFKFKTNDGELISLPKPLDSNESTVDIFLRPTNQPPLVVNNGPGSVPEGGALKITSSLLGSPDVPNDLDIVKAVDPDHTRVQVQYRITGNVSHGILYLGDPATGVVAKQVSVGSAFTLEDLQNGKLWYQHNGTEAAPYGNLDSFTYAISDASGMTEPTATFNINIVPVNDAPVVVGLTGGATFTEGDTSGSPNVTPVLIDSSVTLTDSDLANNGVDFHNGSLRLIYTSSGGNVTSIFDQLAIKNVGAGAGQIGISGSVISYGGVVIGSIDAAENGLNGAALKISFDTSANASLTTAAVKALFEAITFSHTEYDNAVTGTRTLIYTLIDGGGTATNTDSKGTNFTGTDTWTGSATVIVAAANDRPAVSDHTGGGNLLLGTISEDNATPTTFQVASFTAATADATHTGLADVDTGAARGIAITSLSNAATGHWEFSPTGVGGWITIAGVTGTNALLLESTDYIRFVPDGKDGGTATITYLAWDTTSGSARAYANPTTNNTQTSAFSTTTDTAEVIVTPINDAPTFGGVASNIVTATEDTLFSFTGGNAITLGDVDSGTALIRLDLSFTGSGSFKFSSSTALIYTDSAGTTPNATWSGFSDSQVLTLYGTAANLNVAVGKLQYQSATDANNTNLASQAITTQPTVKLDVDDLGYGQNGSTTGIGLTSTKTVTININQANDTPGLSIAAGTLTLTERTSGSVTTPIPNTIFTSDNGDINNSNYGDGTWSNPTLVITALHGTLSLDALATNLNGVLSNGGRTLTLTSTRTGSDVLGDFNTALNTNQYLNYLPDMNFSGTDTLALTLHDNGNAGGTDRTATGTISVSVGGDNDAPSFVALDATPTFVENGGAIILDSNATLADPELSVYNDWGNASMTLVRNGGANGDDAFGVTGSGNVGVNFSGANIRIGVANVGTFTNAGGQLQITFNTLVTTAQANQVLQAITYSNTNNNPPGNVTIDYTVNDGDTDPDRAANGQGTGGFKTGAGSILVSISATNDAPALSGITAKSFTEDGASTAIGSGALPSDPELSFFAGGAGQWGNAYLVLGRNGGAQAEDIFDAAGTAGTGLFLDAGNVLRLDGNVVGTYSNGGGTLMMTFADGVTSAQVQSALSGVTYTNTRQSLGAGESASVSLNWVLHDGDTDADRPLNGQGSGGDKTISVLQTITLNGVNDAPVLADTVLTLTQSEDAAAPSGAVGTLVSSLAGASNITDADTTNPKGLAVIAADSSHGAWYFSINGGTNWNLLAVTGTAARLLASDATTRVCFQPTVDWHGSFAPALTVRAWDQSSGSNGGNVDLSSGGSSGGVTAFSTATDTISLTVSPANDAPTFAGSTTLTAINEDAGSSAVAVATIAGALTYGDSTDNQTGSGGNSTETAQTALAIVGNAATAGQGAWQYTLNGGTLWTTVPVGVSNTTAIVLDLSNASHQVRFVPVSNYNGTPGGLSMRAADGSWDTLTGVQNITAIVGGTGAWSSGTGTLGITVDPVNDAPTITGLGAAPTFIEGVDTAGNRVVIGTPVILDSSVAIGDIEIVTQLVDNFGGSTLTVARDNGGGGFGVNTQDVFGFSGTVGLAGSVISVSGVDMADVTTNSGGLLVVTFRPVATSIQVNTLISALNYAINTDTPPTNVTLRYRFNDDNQGSAQGSGGSLTGDATITVTISAQNDMPLAIDDTHAINENSVNVSGNVIAGTGSPNTAADSDPEGDTLTVAAIRTGTEAAGTGTSGTAGNPLTGLYGTLTLDSDGSYTYAIDNANATVNALRNGEILTETYTYTVSDGHGSTDTAQLTITINGVTDGAPTIIPADGNGAATGEATVMEAGLTSVSDTSETTSGSINVTSPDGMASVTLGGTTFTVAQLATFSVGSPSAVIDTGEGLLQVTGLTVSSGDASAPTSGILTYSYTLKAALTNTGPTASEWIDIIALSITDATSAASTAAGTLSVRIVDDAPTANADTNNVSEGVTAVPTTTAGNVFVSGSAGDVSDRLGADTQANPVTAVSFGGMAGAIGSALSGAYGSLTLNSDGSYSYAVDNTNAAVNALGTGSTLTEVFTYTLTDTDGDTSAAALTITVHGITDGVPAIVPHDGNGAATGEATVNESGLTSIGDTSETTTGFMDLSAVDGLSSISVAGSTISLAQLGTLSTTPITITTPQGEITLTGFTATATVGGIPTVGILDYSYTLTHTQNTPATTENSESIALSITDASAVTSAGALVVRIVDDVPTANADTNSVSEGTTSAPTTTTGNVFASGSAGDVSDRLGADVRVNPVTGVSFGATSGAIGASLVGAYGNLTLNGDGSYVYSVDNTNAIVNALQVGNTLSETFTYTLTDNDGDTNVATLTITLHGRNDPPDAVNDGVFSTPEDMPLNNVPVLANDTDPEGDTLSVTSATIPAPQGSVSINPDGTLNFVPAANFNGVAVISYTISDGHGGTDTATVTIDVIPVNDPPVANDDLGHSVDGRPVTLQILNNDSDLDGDTLTVRTIAGITVVPGSTVPVPSGRVTLNADGTLTFTPTPGAQGIIMFPYEISDGHGGTATANVTITVDPANNMFPDPTPPVLIPLPIAPLFGEQAREPSVFIDGDTFTRVLRLPIPFHPITFVNRTVEGFQRERFLTDAAGFSDPSLVRYGEVESRSMAAGLGMDPAVFVQPAVRASQEVSAFLGEVVDGRLTRTNLSSDRLIPTPELPLPRAGHILIANEGRDLSTEPVHDPALASLEKPVTTRAAAPSFSEQLRGASNRSPVTSRSPSRVSPRN